jgi:hypothetical protein
MGLRNISDYVEVDEDLLNKTKFISGLLFVALLNSIDVSIEIAANAGFGMMGREMTRREFFQYQLV